MLLTKKGHILFFFLNDHVTPTLLASAPSGSRPMEIARQDCASPESIACRIAASMVRPSSQVNSSVADAFFKKSPSMRVTSIETGGFSCKCAIAKIPVDISAAAHCAAK